MVKAVRAAKIKFMVGHVIRFWPEYQLLKQYADEKPLGPLVSLALRRFGEMPTGWKGWFRKPALSGGAALDLHIHDVDYVLYLLGKPKGLDSVGAYRGGSWDQIATHYHYPGVGVTAEGGWWDAPEPFEMAFRAVFAKGILQLLLEESAAHLLRKRQAAGAGQRAPAEDRRSSGRRQHQQPRRLLQRGEILRGLPEGRPRARDRHG